MAIKTQTKHVDYLFLGLVMALLLCGLAMLYSASTVESYKNFGNTSHYFVHQLVYGALVGLIGMFICARIDYHTWRKLIPVFLILSLIALVMVKVPGLSYSANGASRWLKLGPITFQSAELAKLALIFYIAGWLTRKKHNHSFYYGLFPALVIVGLFAILILWQPDLGSMLSVVLTALIMLFVGGTRLKHLAWVIIGGALSLLILIKIEPYRAKRLATFLDRTVDPLGIAYQINQALLAIGGGGLFGYGYGQSRQKYNYLPQASSDSIFAVMAEELGFVRVVLILIVFAAFALRGIKIAMAAPDDFGKLLGIGIIASITVGAIINIGAILGLMPLTGIPLPFFSYGSSSLVITLIAMGIVLNISKQSS